MVTGIIITFIVCVAVAAVAYIILTNNEWRL